MRRVSICMEASFSPVLCSFHPCLWQSSHRWALPWTQSGRDAADVARYMEYVRFQDRPLYPSDSNNGFVYFHLSSSKDLQRVSGLRFEIRNLRSQEATPVFIAFKDNSD